MNSSSDLKPRQSRTCDHCKARKVRCIIPPGAEACGGCLKRKIECHFSHTKRLLRRATPVDPPDEDLAPKKPSGSRSKLYIDLILDNPGLGGVGVVENNIFKIHDHVNSSNLAVFSENRLRLISQRLGHNQLLELVEKIAASVDALNNRVQDTPTQADWQEQSSTTELPLAQSDAALYINAYFEHIHPLYPFIDRANFEQKASLPNLNELLLTQPAFSALYHAVLALGCQHVGDWSFVPGRGKAWPLFHVAFKLLPQVLLPPDSLTSVQAVTAMAIFGISIPGIHAEETLVGEAVRLATNLGFNRITQAGGAEAAGYRTFWVVYVLERMLSFFYARSTILPDYDIGCPVPETPEAEFEGVNFFVIMLRGSRIMSKAYENLFSVSSTMNSTAQYIAVIDTIRGDMDRWVSGIPENLRPGNPFDAAKHPLRLMFQRIHCVYYALDISLCRLELHVCGDQQSPRIIRTRKRLMDTARTIIQMTSYIDVKPYTPLWMLGTIPCSALFILFDFVIHNPTHPETETNLSLLDVVSGYFSRLQYATGGSLPFSMMSGFSHIATEFVRKTRMANEAGGTSLGDACFLPSTTEGISEHEGLSTEGQNLGAPSGAQQLADTVVSPEPLFYPIAGTGPLNGDDLYVGFNFGNLFDAVVPDFTTW
ncbi:fungal-specific transcription factor domain-containing protein [Xylariales sp. PMI_506]|nr:fungal-specific transcription factor domain-containing protein [Xylariales sp. PMI_506]